MADTPKNTPNLEELAPGIIIAMPHLLDPNFNRTVVLLLRSNEQGAIGLVLNREAPLPLDEFCRSQDVVYAGPEGRKLNIGGPVEQDHHLLVLHGDTPLWEGESEDEIELAKGVYLVTAMDGLKALAERGSDRMRCYVGYAGWGPGQLEWELSEGAWVPLTCEPRFVFDEPIDGIWEAALRRAGIDPISLVPGGALN